MTLDSRKGHLVPGDHGRPDVRPEDHGKRADESPSGSLGITDGDERIGCHRPSGVVLEDDSVARREMGIEHTGHAVDGAADDNDVAGVDAISPKLTPSDLNELGE